MKIAVASDSIGQALTLLADTGGFFKKFGVNATVVNANSATNAIAALLHGDAQVFAGTPETMIEADQSTKVLIPLNTYAGVSTSLILSNKTLGKVHLPATASVSQKIKALSGLTIASVDAGSDITATLNQVIATVPGVSVKHTYMPQANSVAALKAGAIDGFITSSPFPEEAQAEGLGKIWLSGPEGQFPGYSKDWLGIAAGFTQDFASSNPKVAEEIVAAYIAAANSVKADPAAAGQELYKAWFSDTSPAVWNAMWSAQARCFTMPLATISGLRSDYTQYVGSLQPGQTAAKPDLKSLLASNVVAKAEQLADK